MLSRMMFKCLLITTQALRKIQKIKNKVNEVGQGLYDLGWGMKTHAEFEREIYGKEKEQLERETI